MSGHRNCHTFCYSIAVFSLFFVIILCSRTFSFDLVSVSLRQLHVNGRQLNLSFEVGHYRSRRALYESVFFSITLTFGVVSSGF